MKKYVGIAVILLATLLVAGLVAGCGSSTKTTPTTPTTPKKTTIKVYTESTKNITAKVGESFIISLKSNPTTGYTWQITGPLSPAVTKVSSTFVPSPNPSSAVGTGGIQNFTFKAASAGQALIQMEYLQAGGGANGGSANFNVTVN